MLLPFVENSFKHGASNDLKSPFIDLKLSVEDNRLNFSIRSSYNGQMGKDDGYKDGIGLKNVKRRLELLYPGKHTLKIIQRQDVFDVNLILELSSSDFKNKYSEV